MKNEFLSIFHFSIFFTKNKKNIKQKLNSFFIFPEKMKSEK